MQFNLFGGTVALLGTERHHKQLVEGLFVIYKTIENLYFYQNSKKHLFLYEIIFYFILIIIIIIAFAFKLICLFIIKNKFKSLLVCYKNKLLESFTCFLFLLL